MSNELFISSQDISLKQAMELIEKNSRGILFLVDDAGILTGCVSDGDIRRWLLKTGNLEAGVMDAACNAPAFLYKENVSGYKEFMKSKRIHAVPILDDKNAVIHVKFDEDYYELSDVRKRACLHDQEVIIMAGGKGTRLYPYTKILPKPLIPIGDKPILERIMDKFYDYGVSQFYLTVNYKKEMIKSYFSEVQKSCGIHFIEEDTPLGTAGSIAFIDHCFMDTVIVTNCDILIEADYGEMLKFHRSSNNLITVVAALKNVVIPYGVLHTKEEGLIDSIEEKPCKSYLINTGLYFVEPKCLDSIPYGSFYHMTDLAKKAMSEGKKVGVYPIAEEDFLDMGQLEELKKMEERINSGRTGWKDDEDRLFW